MHWSKPYFRCFKSLFFGKHNVFAHWEFLRAFPRKDPDEKCRFSNEWRVVHSKLIWINGLKFLQRRLSCIKKYSVTFGIEEISLKGVCLYKERLYTDDDFHLILGFKFATQTRAFTLNLVSRKGSLHRHWF